MRRSNKMISSQLSYIYTERKINQEDPPDKIERLESCKEFRRRIKSLYKKRMLRRNK